MNKSQFYSCKRKGSDHLDSITLHQVSKEFTLETDDDAAVSPYIDLEIARLDETEDTVPSTTVTRSNRAGYSFCSHFHSHFF